MILASYFQITLLYNLTKSTKSSYNRQLNYNYKIPYNLVRFIDRLITTFSVKMKKKIDNRIRVMVENCVNLK